MPDHDSWQTRSVRLAFRLYKGIVSPWAAVFGASCRFTPTCSEYANEALQRHGLLRGAWLTVRRLCRCHPWGGRGYDPVPDLPGARLKPPCHSERLR